MCDPACKKGTMMYLFIILLWIILNGRIDGEIILFGILLSVAVSLFARKVIGYSSKNEAEIIKNLPLLFVYILVLIKEIISSSISVIKLSLKGEKPDPVIVEFDSGFTTNFQNVLLANSITLTPGTITVFQEGGHFVVHCLRREYSEGLSESVFVKLLRKIR